ncbi:MAG: FAD-binding oxidoreductase [Pseudomonadota bacterium]
MHRHIVIGRGLIGSAAARHLAKSTDGVVCIGPDEPTDRAAHTGVFASHYDEGRLTRIFDPMQEWSITAKRAIARYRDIEERSGVQFFTPSGFLGLGAPGNDYTDRGAATGIANGAKISRLDVDQIRQHFPFLSVRDDVDGVLETATAGHVSPRRLVRAQSILAEKAGATLVRQHVTAVRGANGGVEVELADGSTVTGENALIATGAFTQPCGLSPVELGLTVYGRTVLLARVEGELEQALESMPTMVASENGSYILPPIRYPDGHKYVKIGIGTDADPRFAALADLQTWFKGPGSESDRVAYKRFFTSLIPALQDCQHWHTDSCAITKTVSGLPIIDFVHDRTIAVAVGACGKGAKGSDEWGRIAADLLRGAEGPADVSSAQLSLRSKP